jgi:hypothetical protein
VLQTVTQIQAVSASRLALDQKWPTPFSLQNARNRGTEFLYAYR